MQWLPWQCPPEIVPNQSTKICFLKGHGGIGKSEIALKYHDENKTRYQRTIFLTYKDSKEFNEEFKKVISAFGEKPSDQDPKKQIHSILSQERDYLLIIDNIDDDNAYKSIEGLFPTHSNGHVLITGRNDLKAFKKHKIEINQLTLEEGIDLFTKILDNENHAQLFKSEHPEDIKKLIIGDLQGIPLAICIVALFFKIMNTTEFITIKKYYKKYHEDLSGVCLTDDELDQADIGYGKTLLQAFLPNIGYLQEKLSVNSANYQPSVIDIMRFFTFFGTLEYIPIDVDKMYTLFQNIYPEREFSKENIQKIIYHLTRHSLIEVQDVDEKEIFDIVKKSLPSSRVQDKVISTSEQNEGGVNPQTESRVSKFVTIPQPIKWAIRLDYNREIKDLQDTKKSDAKGLWFKRVNQYFNDNLKAENIDATHVLIFISFVHFLEKQDFGDPFKIDFFIHSRVPKLIFELASPNQEKSNQEKAIKLLNLIPSTSLDYALGRLTDSLQSNQPQEMKDKIAESIINLSSLYTESDPKRSEELIRMAIKAGHKRGYFHLNFLYSILYKKEREEEEKQRILEKKLEFSHQQIKTYPFAAAYNNRGVCFTQLKRNEEAVADYKQAIVSNPYEPLYYSNLSSSYLSLSQADNQTEPDKLQYKQQSEDNKRIAESLRRFLPDMKQLSDKYKEAIINYFRSNHCFELAKAASRDSLDADHALFFARIINENSTIKELNLSGCNLDSQGLVAINESLSINECSINELQFDWNPQISDDTILKLFEKASNQLAIIKIDGFGNSQEGPGKKEKLGHSLIQLGLGHVNTNPMIAERCFKAAEYLGNKNACSQLGFLYLNLEEKETDLIKNEAFLKSSLDYCTKQITVSASAFDYNNRGVGYMRLKRYGEAISDFNCARSLDPYNPLYHGNLSIAYSKIPGKDSESQRHGRFSKAFKKERSNFDRLSSDYQKKIIELLNSETNFKLEDSRTKHTMEDRGVMFGKMLAYNLKITTLRLYGCDLSDEGIAAIAKSLEDPNSSIQVLELEWNNLMTDKGLEKLVQMLNKNTKIKSLSLLECGKLTHKGVSEFLNKIQKRSKELVIKLSASGSITKEKLDLLVKDKNIKLDFEKLSSRSRLAGWWR